MNSSEIAEQHGKKMYILALQHAINMIEIGGIEQLEALKKRLEEEKKELKEMEEESARN